jgi:hypothetical protein
MRPSPGVPEVPVTVLYPSREQLRIAGVARPVAGPHTPLYGAPRVSLRLGFELKLIELGSYRVVSATRLATPQEATAALRLLGPTKLQPVLVSGSLIEFFPGKTQ